MAFARSTESVTGLADIPEVPCHPDSSFTFPKTTFGKKQIVPCSAFPVLAMAYIRCREGCCILPRVCDVPSVKEDECEAC